MGVVEKVDPEKVVPEQKKVVVETTRLKKSLRTTSIKVIAMVERGDMIIAMDYLNCFTIKVF